MLASPGKMSSICIAAKTNSLLKQYAIVAGVNDGIVPLPAAISGSDEITRNEGEKSE